MHDVAEAGISIEGGDGITTGDASIQASRFSNNAGAGAVSFGASLSLSGAEIDCNETALIEYWRWQRVWLRVVVADIAPEHDQHRIRSVVVADCSTGRTLRSKVDAVAQRSAFVSNSLKCKRFEQ